MLTMEMKLFSAVSKTKYPLDAFLFVQNGLDCTVHRIHGEDEADQDEADQDETGPTRKRHISGRQLCCGLRDYAIEQYGLMAKTVLQRWGIHKCEDFGHIVFALVDAELMLKTDEDTMDDFTGIFDFTEAFTPTLTLS